VNECLQRLSETKTRLAVDSTFELNIVATELIYCDDPSDQVQSEISPLQNVQIVSTVVPSGQVMWSKEQLINLVLRDLPEDEQYVAWIDSDVAFTDDSWVSNAILKLSLHPLAFGQLWSTCDMLGPDARVQKGTTVKSFAQQKEEGKSYISCSNRQVNDYWHPGFAWCATVEALKRTNFLIDKTLGSADRHMAMSFLGRAAETVPDNIHVNYKHHILAWEKSVLENDIALILIPNHIVHHWHGSLKHRAYMGRWGLLAKHRFDPSRHLLWNQQKGLYYWDPSCPLELQEEIVEYFQNRREDSYENESDDDGDRDGVGGRYILDSVFGYFQNREKGSAKNKDIGGKNGDGNGSIFDTIAGYFQNSDGECGQEIALDVHSDNAVILEGSATAEGCSEGLPTAADLSSLNYYA